MYIFDKLHKLVEPMAIKVFTILESIGVKIPVFLSDSRASSSFIFSQSILG